MYNVHVHVQNTYAGNITKCARGSTFVGPSLYYQLQKQRQSKNHQMLLTQTHSTKASAAHRNTQQQGTLKLTQCTKQGSIFS